MATCSTSTHTRRDSGPARSAFGLSFVILGNLIYGFTSHPTPHVFSARLVLQSVLPLSSVLLGALFSAVLSRHVVQRLYLTRALSASQPSPAFSGGTLTTSRRGTLRCSRATRAPFSGSPLTTDHSSCELSSRKMSTQKSFRK